MLPSGWLRSTLPLRPFLFCALAPFCAPPVLAKGNRPSRLVPRPHGMSLSLVIVVTVQTLVQPAPVFTDTDALMPDLLPAASRACTVYENVVFAASPESRKLVAGGCACVPWIVPASVPL